MQSNYAIFQKQPNTVGSFLQQVIGGLLGPRFTTDVNDATEFLQSPFTDLNSLAPIILDNPTDVFGNIIAENLLTPTDRLDYFDNLNPAPIDPVNYVQPPIQFPTLGEEADTYPDSFGVSETVEDPIYNDPQMIVEDEVPGAGYIEDPVAVEVPMATATPIGQPIDSGPIGQPIDTATTTDTGTNPFYTGATNVAQPPSMTPVAPSYSLDVGMGGMGGFNVPTTPTVPYPTGNYSDQVAVVPYPSTTSTPTSTPILPNEPQTTTTALPTVNSFAGFNGFGGFGGF